MSKKKKTSINYSDIVLFHNPELTWYEKDGIINIDINHTDVISTVMQNLFHVNRQSHLSFSKFETIIWNSIDGTSSVGDIINTLKSQYPHKTDIISDEVMTFTHTLYINNFAIKK